jgi:methionine sulfoxide reductase heme-binding subunit
VTDALWYLGRGTGIVALGLLTLVVALGVGNRAGRPLFGLPRFAVALVHRNASLLAVVFTAIHVVTLMFDPYAQLKLVDLVVPFVGADRPFWLGLGTLGTDLLAAIVVTSLLRARLGRRTFRAVHWLAYACWPVAFLHTLGDGTDAGGVWLRGFALACAGLIVASVVGRLSLVDDGAGRPGRALERAS